MGGDLPGQMRRGERRWRGTLAALAAPFLLVVLLPGTALGKRSAAPSGHERPGLAGTGGRQLALPSRLPERTVRVPILMYHLVGPLDAGAPAITTALTVSAKSFRDEMDWIVAHGFHAISQVQLFDALEHGAPLPAKPVMITFDDGYRDVLWHAAPLLAHLHMPATA